MKNAGCQSDGESGAVLIEGIFGILASIVVMIFLLSLGFYLYQRTMVSIVVNEIAEEIVMTYKFKDVDDSSEISLDDVKNVGRYRYLLFASQYDRANEAKGKTLANIRLSKTSLAQSKNSPKVKIEKIGDDVGRMHYEVTLTQKYNFLLGNILSMIGMSGQQTVSATAYVESVDVSNYINTVKMTNYGLEKFSGANPLLNTVDSLIKVSKSVYSLAIGDDDEEDSADDSDDGSGDESAGGGFRENGTDGSTSESGERLAGGSSGGGIR